MGKRSLRQNKITMGNTIYQKIKNAKAVAKYNSSVAKSHDGTETPHDVGDWEATDETVIIDGYVANQPEARAITEDVEKTIKAKNEVTQAASNEAYFNSFNNPKDIAAGFDPSWTADNPNFINWAKKKSQSVGNEDYTVTEKQQTGTEYRGIIDESNEDKIVNEQVETTEPGRYNMGFGEALSARLGQKQLDKLDKMNNRRDRRAIKRYEGKGLMNKLFRKKQKGDLTADVGAAYERTYGDKLSAYNTTNELGLELNEKGLVTGDADQGLNADNMQNKDLKQLNKGSLRIGGTESPRVSTENVETVIEGGGDAVVTNRKATEEELKKGKTGTRTVKSIAEFGNNAGKSGLKEKGRNFGLMSGRGAGY
tara:strand:+ start:332 stop:1432 length:1101 start_codon:yes stop_codon:yes gene_type:complete